MKRLRPFRAREEITFPTVRFCEAAISLAALRTSPSIARVVRIASLHQTSDADRPGTPVSIRQITLVNYRPGIPRGAGPLDSAEGLRVSGGRRAIRRGRAPTPGIAAKAHRQARRPTAQAILADSKPHARRSETANAPLRPIATHGICLAPRGLSQ